MLPLLVLSAALLTAQLAWWTSAPTRADSPKTNNIVDFEFEPAIFTVPAGATVVWTNLGPTPHDVASADLTWSSEILMTGGTYSYTFNVPGTYQIYCTLHPTMLGSITVTPS